MVVMRSMGSGLGLEHSVCTTRDSPQSYSRFGADAEEPGCAAAQKWPGYLDEQVVARRPTALVKECSFQRKPQRRSSGYENSSWVSECSKCDDLKPRTALESHEFGGHLNPMSVPADWERTSWAHSVNEQATR
jgi:hypothetical protein